MKILLDTQILLWALTNDGRPPTKARRMIEDERNEVYYSVISLWEVQRIHLRGGKGQVPAAGELKGYCEEAGFHMLGLAEGQVRSAESLFFENSGYGGRGFLLWMMAVQATEEDMLFLSADPAAEAGDDPRICYTAAG